MRQMRSISVFNNKGGVGKTTLTFHLAHALAGLGHRVLMIDADPQCNLTLFCKKQEDILKIWEAEENYISDFQHAIQEHGVEAARALERRPRSLHYYLKPVEDGVDHDRAQYKPLKVRENLDLIPGRLSFHSFEEKLVSSWSSLFNRDAQAIRTATSIRQLALELGQSDGYDFVIIDTSPSLGRLNRLLISTSDLFVVPCMPDLFSLYGIKNIGSALKMWREEYENMRSVLHSHQLARFPESTAKFAGYAILNARKRSDSQNEWQLSKAAYRYAKQIPEYISTHLSFENDVTFAEAGPIGGMAIMHSHAGMPSVAQNHHVPMWEVPEASKPSDDDYYSVQGQKPSYLSTESKYEKFAEDLLSRIRLLYPDG